MTITFPFFTLTAIGGLVVPALAVTGGTREGLSIAVVVTGGMKGTGGKGGSGSGGSTGGSGLIIGGTGGNTGSIGGTGGGIGTGIAGGMNTLSPYAIDTAELTVLPKRLNELVVEIVPYPTVLARRLVHRIRFCSCLKPDLNKNLPSLDVADISVDDLRMRCLMISLGGSWYEMTYLGNSCTNNAKGLVETSWCSASGVCNRPKGTPNTVMNLCYVNKRVQIDATVCRYLFTAKSFYMFRASQRPSSGALETVTATSGIGHNTGSVPVL